MGGALDPAVARVRVAVRAALADLPAAEGSLVLVACSGGADSLALAVATAFEAPRAHLAAGAVVVDHGLQDGSAEVAASAADTLRARGLSPVRVERVRVGSAGGPEAAARDARHAALARVADGLAAPAVLLGHTRDDQAETVLLGLARGSGARSLAGMSMRNGRWVRPLLDVDRATTRAFCAAEGLHPWSDPHNDDVRYARVRARRDALPALERALGPGVPAALARTARLLHDDADALDGWADAVASGAHALEVATLSALPRAVRSRVLRRHAIAAGCPSSALSAGHVDELERLVSDWRGQGPLHLPAGVKARRACGRLAFESPDEVPGAKRGE